MKSELIAGLLVVAVALLVVQPAFAGTYTVPPYDGYVLQLNANGKPSGGSSFTTTNDYLCPCIYNNGGHCTNEYGPAEIEEYKYKGIYSGHGGLATVSYTFKLDGNVGVSGSGSATVTSKISLYDSNGNLVTSKTIFSYTITSGTQNFNGNTYTGTISYNLNGYTTYTVRWTVDLKSQGSGNADFYHPYWFTNDMTITTPSGGSPV